MFGLEIRTIKKEQSFDLVGKVLTCMTNNNTKHVRKIVTKDVRRGRSVDIYIYI